MNTDHCFNIGSTHDVCEDYAISGTFTRPVEGAGDVAYAIVCDGCSSADHTDIGARLLAHAARTFLMTAPGGFLGMDAEDIGKLIIHRAVLAASAIGLPLASLEATLVMAAAWNTHARVLMFGDGVCVRRNAATTEVIHVDYKSNAPYYLANRLSDSRRAEYLAKFDQPRRVTIMDHAGSRTQEESPLTPLSLSHAHLSPGDQIILFSDGVNQFYNGKSEKIDWSVPVEVLSKFKNTQGEFVQRRVQAHKRNCAENQIVHWDDVSVAAIVV